MLSPAGMENVIRVVGTGHADKQFKRLVDSLPKGRKRVRFCPDGHQFPSEKKPPRAFKCPECPYEGDRAVTFSEETRFRIEGGRLFHYSVGVAVFCRFEGDEEDRLLILRRATHPIGAFTIPSGHWDLGEDPRASAEKEVCEEAGLAPRSLAWPKKPDIDTLEEGCRSGSDWHIWHFYRCHRNPKDADVTLFADKNRRTHRTGEADMIGWIPESQIKAGLFWLTRPAGHFLAKTLNHRLRHVLPR